MDKRFLRNGANVCLDKRNNLKLAYALYYWFAFTRKGVECNLNDLTASILFAYLRASVQQVNFYTFIDPQNRFVCTSVDMKTIQMFKNSHDILDCVLSKLVTC